MESRLLSALYCAVCVLCTVMGREMGKLSTVLSIAHSNVLLFANCTVIFVQGDSGEDRDQNKLQR